MPACTIRIQFFYLIPIVQISHKPSSNMFPVHSFRPLINPARNSVGEGGLQLHFVNQPMPKVFTSCKIQGEGDSPIKIELFDTRTNSIVRNGPLSSARVEVLVLDGDFGSDDQEDWSETMFRANIVREREGRRPLVVGERSITLEEGVGYLTNIIFTDNSSWIRSRHFRLGAQVDQKISSGVRIREGRSGKFVVKDHRGECKFKQLEKFIHHCSILVLLSWFSLSQ